jgi:hypothetical protein
MTTLIDRLNSGTTVDATISYDTVDAAFIKANSSFDTANTKLNLSGGTITGNLIILGNTNTNVATSNVITSNIINVNTITSNVITSNVITANNIVTSNVSANTFYSPGAIIQNVYKRVDTKLVYSFATAGQTGTFIDALDTTITPKFVSSNVLVQFCISFEVHNDTIFKLFRVVDGSATEIGRNSTDSNYWSGIWLPGYDADNNSTARTNQYFFLDTTGLTSIKPITYRLMIQSGGVGATELYLNRTVGSAGQANHEVAISQVLLQEIAV